EGGCRAPYTPLRPAPRELPSLLTVDSRERVEAAVAGGEVDHPPIGAWGHTYKDEWSPEELAAVTVARARKYRWDFVKFQPRATCFAEAFGGRWHPAGHRLKGPVLDAA